MHSSVVGILQWQLCLFRFLPTILILIWIYTFESHKLKLFVSLLKLSKVSEAKCRESATSYEPQLNILPYLFTIFIGHPSKLDVDFNIENSVLPFVFWNDYNNTIIVKTLSWYFKKQTSVRTTQVVKHNGYVIWNPIFYVEIFVGCSSI